MHFGLAASRPCLAFHVIFFAAVWLMPLISKPPDMTWITRSCQGVEAGTASVGFPDVSLLRWLLAFSERNCRRDVRNVRPRGHCHPFCLLDPSVLVPAPVSAPGILCWSWRGSLVSLVLVWPDHLGILLLLHVSTTCDNFFPFYLCPGSG
ncbi:hypothetical protein F2Q69_00028863 [Brassica cretica]|uniref:Uncharacterized protein n=1 Tax=Brassica cretica TaxID=69181 RepID=A0A8S9S7E3_BRACR|nr:hypothetical protein F2Q69_00028863 [Brassica cretica]